ncbi:MAG: CaiB/BaiF CoA transferase family protein, partial [Alphaproteobacteria bacterium]
MQSAALTGLTVLDFTRVIAGPFLTQMLADLGADVIKVEAPGVGDDMRHYRPAGWKKDAPGFIGLNRNKRSIEIDITTDAGREVCCALAEKADILVENFRPDVMERYGLHYDALSKINPKLIYCSISGYGHTSPYRLVAGYDPIAQAESGMMYLTGP